MTGGRAGLSCSWCASQALETCSVPLEIIFFFGSVTSTIHICLKKKKKKMLAAFKELSLLPVSAQPRWGSVGMDWT